MCFIIYKCFINKIKNIIKMIQGQGNLGPIEAGKIGNSGPKTSGGPCSC